MIGEKSKPKPRENAWLWLVKIIGGLLIVVVLGIHFAINHLIAPGGLLSYQDVIRYYQVPIVPIMEIFFLIFVVSHSLLGLRSILLDLNPSNRILKGMDWALALIGTGAILYGSTLILILTGRGD